MPASQFGTVWLTGFSGSGKTTIANAIEQLLHRLGLPCCVLDGDELRSGLSSDLGFSRADRREQVRRAAHVAVTLAGSGVFPIVALVSPYAEDRLYARQIHEFANVCFLEVWVDTPLEICRARDVKGLYTRADQVADQSRAFLADGSGLTGITAPYESPDGPELRIIGHGEHPRVAAKQVVAELLAILSFRGPSGSE